MIHKNDFKTLLIGIKEIYQSSYYNLLTTIFFPLLESTLPFLNILIITYCVFSYEQQIPLKKTIFKIFVFIFLNFFLTFISDCLSQKFISDRKIIFQNERKNIIDKLFFIPFENLDNYETQNLCNLHSALSEQAGSPLYRLSTQIYMFNKGIFTLILSSIYVIIAIKSVKINFSQSDTIFILLMGLFLVLSIIFILTSSSRTNKKKFILSKEFSRYESIFDYYFNIISNVKNKIEIIMNKEETFLYNKATELLDNMGTKTLKNISKISGIHGAKISIIGMLLTFSIYSFFTSKALLGNFSTSSIVILISTVIQIIFGITSLVDGLGKLHLTLPVLDCYIKIKNLPKEKLHYKKVKQYSDIPIEFKNVYYKYPNSNDYIIKNISFKIKNNDIIGIVGTNGSGKSTLIKLMCGLYKPTKGDVYINSINTKELSANDLKQIFGVVFQDFNIFPYTIAENIATSNNYNSDMIFSSLKNVDLFKKVMSLPINIYSKISDSLEDTNVINLSIGESQKLVIARTQYFNKQINIYDEPTSSLDPYAEMEIYSMIQNSLNSTAIFISHRLSTCKFCKKILLLEKGELIGYDSHDKLINNNIYKNLWETQSSNY